MIVCDNYQDCNGPLVPLSGLCVPVWLFCWSVCFVGFVLSVVHMTDVTSEHVFCSVHLDVVITLFLAGCAPTPLGDC